MNPASHTPGEWVIRRADGVGGVIERNITFPSGKIGNKQVDEFVIATVNSYYFGPHDAEPEANARLIASAPALLEALNIMVRAFNVETIDPLVAFMAIEKAKAAIAEATQPEGGR